MLAACAEKDRVEPRIRAMVRATLRDSRDERDICLVDISTRGLLATAARPPKMGEIIELRVGRNVMVGQVRWASQRRFGVALRDRISVAALVEGGGRDASLNRSAAAKPKGQGIAIDVGDNPALFSRLGQLIMLGLIAAGAAYAITGFSSEGIAPVGKAMAEVNAANQR